MVVLAACRNERGCRCRDSNRSGHCDVDWPVLRSGSQKRSQNHVIGGKRRHVRWCPLRAHHGWARSGEKMRIISV